MSQTLYTLIRNSFRTALRRQVESFEVPPCPIEFPLAFWANVEDNMRLAAYDAAAKAAAQALHTMDLQKVHAAMRRAGIKYLPAADFETEDGVTVHRNPTAQLVEEDFGDPVVRLAIEHAADCAVAA